MQRTLTISTSVVFAIAFTALASGPEVATNDVSSLTVYAALNGSRAVAVGGTWCNLGDAAAPWSSTTAAHPVTGTNLLRVENGALRQIGLSWAWHHVSCPLQQNACEACNPEPGVCPSMLGIGCSTTSTAAALGTQPNLGMRSLVDAASGAFPFPFSGPPITDVLARRCKYLISDVDPAAHRNAHFALQTLTIASTDGDPLLRSAYREISGATLTNGGGAYAGPAIAAASAVDFWRAIEPSVSVAVVDIPQDGRVLVAARVTPDPDCGWRYDYAIENLDSAEGIGGLTVPIAGTACVNNVVFAAPLVHSGEVTSNAPWTASVSASDIAWATTAFAVDPNANAVRWGTTYSFGFTTSQPPAIRSATLTLFHSGSTTQVAIPAPSSPADLTGDGSVNSADLSILLGAWGRCNGCAADLNGDGIVDSADLAILLGAWG